MADVMNDMRFDEQVAVTTGAGRGLGKEYARLLAARGARIVVNDLGGSVTGVGAEKDTAHATAREINDQGGEAVADENSVATPEGGQAIIDTALQTWGRVDILVNNAGTVSDSVFDDMTDARLSPLLDVHLKGAFFVTRPAWRVMRQREYGRVINTCSAAGILGAERMANYGAAKTGLIGLTRILAAEADEVMRPFVDRLDPGLVAPVVAFLAHSECPVSGEIFTVGAGHVARFFIGRTKGYFNPRLSMEDVRTHLDEIRDETDYTVPAGPAEEMVELFKAIA